MAINVVEQIDGLVKVRNILISVSKKDGLETFVPDLVEINPDIMIFSTGGTFGRIKEFIGSNAESNLMQVSDFTKQPETQGGLVKTLDFKIYLGILTETYNEAHQADLKRTRAVPIDMVVCNLYPFKETISKEGVTVEQARGQIDIGGPTMIRAAAKNFLRVAVVVNPMDYPRVINEMKMIENQGKIPLSLRYEFAQNAFEHTAVYDRHIADFLGETGLEDVESCYQIQGGE